MLPFQKLHIWTKSMSVAKETYRLIRLFPQEEVYGLSSQMRRASVSIPSNIAEGSQRNSIKEFRHFLSIARGSLAELQTQYILAYEAQYLSRGQLDTIIQSIEEVSKMMRAFHASLKEKTTH